MSSNTPGLGESQKAIIEAIKRRGSRTIRSLAAELDLSVETVRDHLKSLTALGLARRATTLKERPGRPEIVYALTPAAEAVFPRREGEILAALASYLKQTGNEPLLRDFYQRFIASRREEALARVAHLSGQARVEEVARILSELGFMAVLEGDHERTKLRLCHCPLRDLVAVTQIPCGIEVGFIHELLGERATRISHMPAGGESCSYLTALEVGR